MNKSDFLATSRISKNLETSCLMELMKKRQLGLGESVSGKWPKVRTWGVD